MSTPFADPPDQLGCVVPAESTGSNSLSGGGGFSPDECTDVFHDGEFVGDLRTVELADGFAELVYAPVPSEG
jgi:hypothetical protein